MPVVCVLIDCNYYVQHGAPPAAKETVEHLPKLKIAQSDVDENAECPVCKDAFAVDEDAHKLPCTHMFHPDCILPWLKQVSTCSCVQNVLDSKVYTLLIVSKINTTAQLLPSVPL